MVVEYGINIVMQLDRLRCELGALLWWSHTGRHSDPMLEYFGQVITGQLSEEIRFDMSSQINNLRSHLSSVERKESSSVRRVRLSRC